MRSLVFEDRPLKYRHICEVLQECGYTDVDWADNLADGLQMLAKAEADGDPYELVVTDMYYPADSRHKGADDASGEVLIGMLAQSEKPVPVILCSSNRFHYDGILGCVQYSESGYWESELRALAKQAAANIRDE